MASRGTNETLKLKQNISDQLDRLMNQLQDIEDNKNEMDKEEYEELKQETVEQLEEFRERLQKMAEGDLSLIDDINRMQLAIQAAISDAFKTPEVIKMFAKKEPGQLRQRLGEIERDAKIGKLSHDVACQQKLEVLMALKKLGEVLQPAEEAFLQENASVSMKQFEAASTTISGEVLNMAGSQVKAAHS